MLIDEFIDDEDITEQLQNALEYIDKYKDEIEGVFDSMYAIALSKFSNVTRTDDCITITFNSSVERDVCEDFYKKYLIQALTEILDLDRKMFYLIFKIYTTKDYTTIIRKRK